MRLYVDPSIPRFTRNELVAEMTQTFGDFSDGAFRRWQEQGLVAPPRITGRWAKGESGSSKGMWSDHDRRMLIALLQKRDEHRREGRGQLHVAELANLVVWSWIFWDGFVTLDQAQRALRTWAKPQVGGVHGAARSRERILSQVRAAVASVAAPGVPVRAQRGLAARIANLLWTDDLGGLEGLVHDLDAVIDPDGCGRRVGSAGASTDGRGEVERIRLAHFGANAVISGQSALRTKDWYAAREILRRSWLEYERDWPRLQSNASTPDVFGPADLTAQITLCSRTLLYTLGRTIADRDPGGSSGGSLSVGDSG